MIAIPDIPTPALMRQTSRGPPDGHESSRPVSGEIPLRRGPRNCGQPTASVGAALAPESSPWSAPAEIPRNDRTAASRSLQAEVVPTAYSPSRIGFRKCSFLKDHPVSSDGPSYPKNHCVKRKDSLSAAHPGGGVTGSCGKKAPIE